MDRLALFLLIILSAVTLMTAPVFARGIMKDLGAAGSLDQRYQTNGLLEEAPPVAGAGSNRPGKSQNSRMDPTEREARDADR